MRHYIKSSETFRDYTFKLDSGKRVNMRIVAASTEQNNNKEAAGKERRFILCAEALIGEENGELHIRFEYRPSEGKEKQSDLNQQAIKAILAAPGLNQWTAQLAKAAPTEKDSARTVLAKHLTQFTARNEFDYFIHKDLGGFLRRELDFYIKNEVMHLDDIENDSAPRVEQFLSLIRVIRKIAHKIIAFLEQLENFQKKLWLKKKFVIETHYCITLDRIPEEMYIEIAANDAQREEWVKLFAIDEIAAEKLGEAAYSKPLTREFLKAQPHLVLDTRNFPEDFKQRLLATIGSLDETLGGLLIHSENFQALRLIEERYRGQVDCVYIDPPYNTGDDDDFCYKDEYRSSSWLAMMASRLAIARPLLAARGTVASHIDEHEFRNMEWLLVEIFGAQNVLQPVVWDKRNPKGDATGIAQQHEYIAWAVREFSSLKVQGAEMSRPKPNAKAIIEKARQLVAKAGGTTEKVRTAFREWVRGQNFSGGEAAYCEIDDGGEVFQSVSMAWPNKKKAPPEYFIPLNHPRTGNACPVPERGWRNPPDTMHGLLKSGQIIFGADEAVQPRRKYLLRKNMDENVPSLLYFGGSDDDLMKGMCYEFPNPKPLRVAEHVVRAGAGKTNAEVLDYFAGSGTTAHAVISLNREDDGTRKYILVEMGEYFHTVLLPRIKKVVYSKDWKDGKPTARETGISHAFKYLRLESYEDALANLELSRTPQQSDLLKSDSGVREQYMLSYMLDVESRGSQSLLNIESFRNPDQYKLKVERNGEAQLVNVDLPETFNWLLGLTVKHIDVIRGVRVIDGTNPKGDRVLVLWRNMDEMDNDKLDQWFQKQNYNTRELEYDIFYVNGDNNLENLRRADQTWKVRLIEEEFKRLMFDVGDV